MQYRERITWEKLSEKDIESDIINGLKGEKSSIEGCGKRAGNKKINPPAAGLGLNVVLFSSRMTHPHESK